MDQAYSHAPPAAIDASNSSTAAPARLPLHINTPTPVSIPVTASSYIPGPGNPLLPPSSFDAHNGSLASAPGVYAPTAAPLPPPPPFDAPTGAIPQPLLDPNAAPHGAPVASHPPAPADATTAPNTDQPHSFDNCPACRAEYEAAVAASLNTDAERRRVDEERERAELENAIRLSEQEATAHPPQPAGALAQGAEDEEEEQLRRVIEESARNAAEEEERRRQWRESIQHTLGEGSSAASASTSIPNPEDEEELLRRVMEESARTEAEAKSRREQEEDWEASILNRSRRAAELVEEQRELEVQEASMWRSPDAGSNKTREGKRSTEGGVSSGSGAPRGSEVEEGMSRSDKDKDAEDYSLGLGLRASRRSQEIPSDAGQEDLARAIAEEVRSRAGRRQMEGEGKNEGAEIGSMIGGVPTAKSRRSQADEESFWRQPTDATSTSSSKGTQQTSQVLGDTGSDAPSASHQARLARAALESEENGAQTMSLPPMQIAASLDDSGEDRATAPSGSDVPESVMGSLPPSVVDSLPPPSVADSIPPSVAPEEANSDEGQKGDAAAGTANVDVGAGECVLGDNKGDPPSQDAIERPVPDSQQITPESTSLTQPVPSHGPTNDSNDSEAVPVPRPLPVPPGPPPVGSMPITNGPPFTSIPFIPASTAEEAGTKPTASVDSQPNAQEDVPPPAPPAPEQPTVAQVDDPSTSVDQEITLQTASDSQSSEAKEPGLEPPSPANDEQKLSPSQVDAPIDVDTNSISESNALWSGIPEDLQSRSAGVDSDEREDLEADGGDATPLYTAIDPQMETASAATSIQSGGNTPSQTPLPPPYIGMQSAVQNGGGVRPSSASGSHSPSIASLPSGGVSQTDSTDATPSATTAVRRVTQGPDGQQVGMMANPLFSNPLLSGLSYSHNAPPVSSSMSAGPRERSSLGGYASVSSGVIGSSGGLGHPSGASIGGNAFVQSGSAVHPVGGGGRWSGEPQIALALRRNSAAVHSGFGANSGSSVSSHHGSASSAGAGAGAGHATSGPGRASFGSSFSRTSTTSPPLPPPSSPPSFNPLFSAFGAEAEDANRTASEVAAHAPVVALPREHIGGWVGTPSPPRHSVPLIGTMMGADGGGGGHMQSASQQPGPFPMGSFAPTTNGASGQQPSFGPGPLHFSPTTSPGSQPNKISRLLGPEAPTAAELSSAAQSPPSIAGATTSPGSQPNKISRLLGPEAPTAAQLSSASLSSTSIAGAEKSGSKTKKKLKELFSRHERSGSKSKLRASIAAPESNGARGTGIGGPLLDNLTSGRAKSVDSQAPSESLHQASQQQPQQDTQGPTIMPWSNPAASGSQTSLASAFSSNATSQKVASNQISLASEGAAISPTAAVFPLFRPLVWGRGVPPKQQQNKSSTSSGAARSDETVEELDEVGVL
ncbi:hypothetical protein A4X09_0g6322 [Tilletia walkeri]|uniref:Uncharacterized protein n=1 Tax=Tilletia walkeri TaxID=117179 RepID=A0A8X7N5G5_9BASI|nr:hypothetical protein A4X09_0g6322 [Tilletia walkeri]